MLGQLHAPSGFAPDAAAGTTPEQTLRLEFVHGYRGQDSRSNLYFNAQGRAVYPAAGLGVVLDPETNTQTFFRGHDDDIISLAIHPDRKIAATGQIGHDPSICVWDTETMETLAVLKGFHERGVCALGFSKDGSKLASVGLDNDHSLAVYEWQSGRLLASSKLDGNRVLCAKFNPHDDTLVTCGVKSIKFWTLDGRVLSSKKGIWGKKGSIQTLIDVAFPAPDVTITTTSSGVLYRWDGRTITKACSSPHKGAAFSITADGAKLLSGGKDGTIRVWSADLKLESTIDLCAKADSLHGVPAPRAIDVRDGAMLVGTRECEVFRCDAATGDNATVLVRGHAKGELWGVAGHPSKDWFATCSDDETLRVWDASAKKMHKIADLGSEARCVSYSPDGAQLAIGFLDGAVEVRDADSLEVVSQWKRRREEISAVRFSPDGSMLAVGSHDNFIDLYRVPEMKRFAICRGHTSFVKHLDWSADSKYLQSNCGAHEILFWTAADGKQVKESSSLADVEWASWSCVIGWPVQGIWPKYSDKTDVNLTARSKSGTVLATADDFGMVKLFRWPVTVDHAKNRAYKGHSSHVTGVLFLNDESHLVSVGGNDQCVFQWRYTESPEDADEDDNLDECEEGDEDLELEVVALETSSRRKPRRAAPKSDEDKAAEDDSDASKAFETRVSESAGEAVTPSEYKPSPEDATAPDEKLTLEFVHGYRGQDARHNLFYGSSAKQLVYSAAGVGIVYDKEAHEQAFFREHTDDIISLAYHAESGMVVTGQVGHDPPMFVWSADGCEKQAELQGFHERGISAVAFSNDGSLVFSVGLDDNNSVAVYDWKEKKLLASSKASVDKILDVVPSPHDNGSFVTVGIKHIKFWNYNDGVLTVNKGTVGRKGKVQTHISACYVDANTVVTATSGGDLYKFAGTKLESSHEDAHKGAVFQVAAFSDADGVLKIASAGKDRKLKVWAADSLTAAGEYGLDGIKTNGGKLRIKSIDYRDGSFVLGTSVCSVYELAVSASGEPAELLSGHAEGELWGLATHPTASQFATCSDDGTVRVWDLGSRKQTDLAVLDGGEARSIAYSPDGNTLAIGFKDGAFEVRAAAALGEVVKRVRKRREEIGDIKFSPDGKWLAVGSHDNFVDVYSVEKGYRRTAICRGHSSFITHFDFSADSKYIQTDSGDYEHLFWQVEDGKHITRSSELKDVDWATWSCVLGWPVQGIWPKYSDKTDVNAVDRAKSGKLLATADDFGDVKLFRYPVVNKRQDNNKHTGHSSHVTCVRFAHDDAYLVSVGGNDQCVFQWKM